MPLPTVGQTMELVASRILGNAMYNHPPVTGATAEFEAKVGNATWLGNKLVMANEGLRNYWSLPAIEDKVSVCVVHANGYGTAYVLSMNYAGCEYHELFHPVTKQTAFLHVYSGVSGPVAYTMAAGWTLKKKIYSKGLVKRFGNGPVWSISCIDRTTSPPTVTSKFIGAKGTPLPPSLTPGGTGLGVVSNPLVTVTHEDDGTNPS